MPPASQDPSCRRCGRPVRLERERYEVFEGMHYVCFHYEFEHDSSRSNADPDEDCGVPGCPLEPDGVDAPMLIAAVRELAADWAGGPPTTWEHHSLPAYLEALAAWLENNERHYTNLGHGMPRNATEAVVDGLRAATVYE